MQMEMRMLMQTSSKLFTRLRTGVRVSRPKRPITMTRQCALFFGFWEGGPAIPHVYASATVVLPLVSAVRAIERRTME